MFIFNVPDSSIFETDTLVYIQTNLTYDNQWKISWVIKTINSHVKLFLYLIILIEYAI